jgi:hypothetical protein
MTWSAINSLEPVRFYLPGPSMMRLPNNFLANKAETTLYSQRGNLVISVEGNDAFFDKFEIRADIFEEVNDSYDG